MEEEWVTEPGVEGVKRRRRFMLVESAVAFAAAVATAQTQEQAQSSALASTPPPELSVSPAEVKLSPGREWAQLTYTLNNGSQAGFAIESRFADFESVPPGWKSARIGPFSTALALPPHSSAMMRDNAYVPIETLQEARRAGALDSGKIVLAQSFAFKPNPAGVSNLTARVTFVLDYPVTDIAETNFSTARYDVSALKLFTDEPKKMARLRTMLEYADKSYDALTRVLGIQPLGTNRIQLWLNSFDGSPCYVPTPVPHMSIPWNVVEAQGGIQFLFVVYPHELAHYFLMTRFPDPPKWFIEGPASFFGNKVALALGYRDSAAHDRKKILGFAELYKAKHCNYCFDPRWPEDEGRNDNPNDLHSLGFGYAYEICLELEQLCGEDFFPKTFRAMAAKNIDFSKSKEEREKNRLLLEAFQSETKKDLWTYFQKKGFRRD
jgi:hypothetical protein